MELPDPFTEGLKVDRLEAVRKSPVIRGDVEAPLRQAGIKDAVDALLRSVEQDDEHISQILEAVCHPQRTETGYDFVPIGVDTVLLHALALHIGASAVTAAGSKGLTFSASSPHAKLLEKLTMELRPEARYHFLAAITFQLRYPSSHTHYFSSAILHLFGHSTDDQRTQEVQQQITRVVLDRIVVNRPHAWGLAVTLLELFKNPDLHMWDLPWMKAMPEVYINLFSSPT
ncbi:CCR4-NOT core subunit cdc39, partial [Cryomyces antarcticus]